MKATVFYGPKDIRLEDVPEPAIRSGSVKVKVDWCGICGTDLHEYLAGPIFIPPEGSPHPITGETLPLTLGHEFAGEVAETDDGPILLPKLYLPPAVQRQAARERLYLERLTRLNVLMFRYVNRTTGPGASGTDAGGSPPSGRPRRTCSPWPAARNDPKVHVKREDV